MADQEPTPDNITMMQGFEWYVPADKKHWVRLEKHVPRLKEFGIDNIWIPPGYEIILVKFSQASANHHQVARALPLRAMVTTSTICEFLISRNHLTSNLFKI